MSGATRDPTFQVMELGVIQPVKPEWIVGKALFAIPLLGYIPLNILPVLIIVILMMGTLGVLPAQKEW